MAVLSVFGIYVDETAHNEFLKDLLIRIFLRITDYLIKVRLRIFIICMIILCIKIRKNPFSEY